MGIAKVLVLVSAFALTPAVGDRTAAPADDDLDVGLYTLFLSCADQSEFVVFPDWCGEILETRDLMPAPSGND